MGKADEDYEFVNNFADRLGLEDQDREKFVNSSMQRFGYKPKMSWDEPEDQNDDGGDFFSGRRQQRQQRQVRDDRGGGRRASGGGMYED